MNHRRAITLSIALTCWAQHSHAQQSPDAIPITVAAAPPVITLDQALSLAKANEPNFAAAQAASRTAALDHAIARSAILPTVVYHNQYQYTQPNGATNQAGSTGTQAAPRFIANNAVHEYASQAVVNETLGLAQWNQLARTSAAAAIAQAEAEISRRGLTATVVTLFYGITTANTRVDAEQHAAQQAADFVTLTTQREAARESAHADVLKAQLTLQQRQRDLADATLAAEKARLDLAVLLFPDPRSPYTVLNPATRPLPTQAEIATLASANNPELQSALATLHAANLDIKSARAAYLPDLALNYTYGIDAEQFAVNGPQNATQPGGQPVRNLGYSASATLDIPVWDWLSTQHKIRQTQILRDAAKVALTSTQRTLIAQLDQTYHEAALADSQLASLQLTVDTARESLRLTQLRYTAGESTVLEVVDAESTLTAAELGLAEGHNRSQLALANLQLLTGTL